MNASTFPKPTLRAAILIAANVILLTGCDNSGPGMSSPSAAQARIAGHVLDDDGPVTQARVEAKDARGAIAARTELKGESTYTLTIPSGTVYPLIISAYPEGTATQPLKAAVTDSRASQQDISPVTTIVVDTAMSLGGLTEANIAKAAGAALAQRKKSGGSGSSQGFKGDPTKQYGGWH